MSTQAGRLTLLRWILAFSVLSTAIHFTHNFVEIHRYPDDLVSADVIQVAIIVSWPLFTAIGVCGYRLYSQRRFGPAHACLASYSLLGLTTPGHFLDATPDIAPFWFATIFTDGLAGLAILAFTVWSMRATGSRAAVAAGRAS